MLKIHRVDEVTSTVIDSGPTTTIYANQNIKLEPSALTELETFRTIDGIKNLSITPDFHRGSGTPIGTTALIDRVYPQVVGGDIGCGLRLDVTSLSDVDVTPSLKDKIRHAFFGGGREVLVDSRSDVLAYGLQAKVSGRSTNRIPSIQKSHANGALGYGSVADILSDYANIDSKIDNFLGTIGGGNHFVELQRVTKIVDKHAAYAAGIKVGSICIMSHSGSLDIGHVVANHHKEKAKSQHVGQYPVHGYFQLDNEFGLKYITDSYNAANFAMVNRAVMNSMLADVLDTELTSVYDSPHNLVWYNEDTGMYLHRKGSCPANENELVMIPGSMGTASCLAIGQGFAGTMSSSAHGAGRVLNRNAARAVNETNALHIITKIDPDRVRADIAKEVMKTLNEEAPSAYKDIGEVISTSVDAGILNVVAWLEPILTVKG